MSSPTLSVCIPSFNRADCLRQCLESITGQFSEPAVREQVEIVISDNASADATTEVVVSFQKKFSNIVYVRNEQNVGYDRNALQVIAKAQGDYVWLLGDDDGLLPGSLKYILPVLQSNKFDYLLANGWGYDKNLQKRAVNRPYLPLSQNLEFARLSQYVQSVPDYKNLVGNFGGMSAQIFKRQPWLDLPNKESFVGSHIIHLFVILRAFKDLPCSVLAEPLYMGRSDNLRWEIFPGLETLAKRSATTQRTLLWILREYNLAYSPLKLKVFFTRQLLVDSLKAMTRKYILKNQKSRDLLKKALGR